MPTDEQPFDARAWAENVDRNLGTFAQNVQQQNQQLAAELAALKAERAKQRRRRDDAPEDDLTDEEVVQHMLGKPKDFIRGLGQKIVEVADQRLDARDRAKAERAMQEDDWAQFWQEVRQHPENSDVVPFIGDIVARFGTLTDIGDRSARVNVAIAQHRQTRAAVDARRIESERIEANSRRAAAGTPINAILGRLLRPEGGATRGGHEPYNQAAELKTWADEWKQQNRSKRSGIDWRKAEQDHSARMNAGR